MFKITISSSAERELKSLAKSDKMIFARVKSAINELGVEPRPNGVKKLAGMHDTYRIRTGDYRIMYTIEHQILTIAIIRVAHRREVYKK